MDLALQVKLLLILKALIEVAAVALLGQGLVALFAGVEREKNVIYQLFKIVTKPAVKLARWLTPVKLVRESHLPLVAFFICVWLWVGCIIGVSYVCGQHGLTVAQCTGKSS